MKSGPDTKADLVAMLQRAGLHVIDTDLDGWRVAAESDHFRLLCNEGRRGAPWNEGGATFSFLAKEPLGREWMFTLAEAQRMAGLAPSTVPVTDLGEAERRIRELRGPLDRALAGYAGRPAELMAALRRLRFS